MGDHLNNQSSAAADGARVFISTDDVMHEALIDEGAPPMEDEEADGVDDDNGDGEEEAAADMATESFESHTGPVYAVAINPKDPRCMLTGGGDDRAFFWKATSLPGPGEGSSEPMVHELDNHGDSVNAVAFSHDGSLAATGAFNGRLMIWDAKTKALMRTLEGPEDIEWLDWHSKGNILIAGSKDCTVWMWLASTGDCMKVFTGHEGPVTCGLFTADGKQICTGSQDGTVRVWGPKAGVCKHVYTGHGFHEGPVTALASHHDGNLVLSGGMDGTARLLHVPNKKILATLVHTEAKPAAAGAAGGGDEMEVEEEETFSVEAVGFSRVFNWCATGGMDGTLKIWDLANFSCRHVCVHENGGVVKLAWHSTAPLVYTACTDAVVRLWDARSGELLYSLTGHEDMILDFALVCRPAEEGGDVVLTGSDDGKAKVFSVSLE